MLPIALTMAGSDPSGGAGIQADLKTFHQFGVYGEAVITLITVQNTRGVRRGEGGEAGVWGIPYWQARKDWLCSGTTRWKRLRHSCCRMSFCSRPTWRKLPF